jgi:ABC-type hemin transport system ATPase subunit
LDKGKIVVSGKPSEVITQENILKVYGKGFNVVIHPDSGKPVLYPGIFPEGIL